MASKSAIEETQKSGTPDASGKPAPNSRPGKLLTKADIVKSCVDNGFYRTPHCNERLYLHYKGYDAIGGLEEFTEALVIWLEGNAISRIEGLHHCPKLKQLFLQENCLTHLGGLDALVELDTLNVSDNFICKIENLTTLERLTTLRIKNNKIKSPDDFAALAHVPRLSCLDLSGNQIEDGEALLATLEQIPDLRSLYLTGNPCVRTIQNYRRTVISRLKQLKYLDDKPVFDDERRLVDAWARGGNAAEKAERQQMKAEEEQEIYRRLDEFKRWSRGSAPTDGAAASDAVGSAAVAAAPSASGDGSKTKEDSDESSDTDSCPTPDSSGDEDEGAVWVPPSASSAAPPLAASDAEGSAMNID